MGSAGAALRILLFVRPLWINLHLVAKLTLLMSLLGGSLTQVGFVFAVFDQVTCVKDNKLKQHRRHLCTGLVRLKYDL